jgi:hypothetical protein
LHSWHAVLAGVCVAALSACGTGNDELGADSHVDVVRDGSRVTGTGRVVSVPGRPVRLCADTRTADVGYEPGHEPPPKYCEHGVDVSGIDVNADRREKDGAVEGRATLLGTWRGDLLEVEEQRPPEPMEGPKGARTIGNYNYVPTPSPCPLPEGGLPRTDIMENLTHASPAIEEFCRAHPGLRPFSALRRPEPDQVVFALAVQDDQERQDAERLLMPILGEHLCVIDARVTPEQVEAAATEPPSRSERAVTDPSPRTKAFLMTARLPPCTGCTL